MIGLFGTFARRLRRDVDVTIGSAGIANWQYLFVATSALPFITTVSLSPELTQSRLLFAGALIVVITTMAAGLIRWEASWSRWALLLALADIVGVLLMYVPTPGAGFSILLVLPVVWAAIAFGASVCAAFVILTLGCLWSAFAAQVALFEEQSFVSGAPATMSVTSLIVLGAVAAAQTDRTASARLRLLRRQSDAFSRALERTSEQERFIASVLDALDVAVFSFAADGELRSANRSAWLLLRHIGGARLEPTLAAYAVDRNSQAFAPDGPLGRALAHQTIDRETAWFGGAEPVAVEVSSRLITDDDGGIETIVVIARDVTREREAASERDSVVTSVTHEFRAPLTSILGYLELALEEPDLPPLPREMLDIALKNTERLLALSNDFLAARTGARAEDGIALHLEDCRPAAILEDAVAAVRPQAIARSISILVPALPDVTLPADPLRLRQVIDNLLTNAVKYNVHGGRIEVRASVVGDDCYEVTVRDTGRGMTAREAELAFDRGFRAVSARSSAVGGSGLGLDISRKIVAGHRGNISLDSRVGEGTTVTLTLPLAPCPDEDEVD